MKRKESKSLTGFLTGQIAQARPCSIKKPDTGPFSPLLTFFYLPVRKKALKKACSKITG